MRAFLYTPRAGSRLLSGPGWGVEVKTRPWGDKGTHTAEKAPESHDIECYAVVRAETANSSDHWRDTGRSWIALLVAECGGAAADDRGELLYFAPSASAADAARMVFALLSARNPDQAARLRLEVAVERSDLGWGTGWSAVEIQIARARDKRIEAERAAFEARLAGEAAP